MTILQELEFLCEMSTVTILEHSRSNTLVVVDHLYREEICQKILGLGFAGIIFTRRPSSEVAGDGASSSPFAGDIGWIDLASGEIKLPCGAATEVFVCSLTFDLLGVRSLRVLQNAGIENVALVGQHKIEIRRRKIGPLIVAVGMRRLVTFADIIFAGRVHAFLLKMDVWVRLEEFEQPFSVVEQKVSSGEFADKKVAMVCGALGAGGAERQVVNTAIGLNARGASVTVFVPFLGRVPSSDFYLDNLTSQGIEVCVPTLTGQFPKKNEVQFAQVTRLLAPYPEVHTIFLSLLSAFLDKKPDIVHGWLDMTSIATGYAATIAGVPQIVLSARSVAPPNFSFEQPYMKPAYRQLLACPNVTFMNNSYAGAEDYGQWLGVDPKKIKVVRNGVDTSHFRRSSKEDVNDYRYSMAVPEGKKVVMTLIRFTEEKRPFFWIKVAAEVLKSLDCCFVMLGDGPLRSPIQKWVDENGYSDHIRLPGHESNAALALSAADCFLLTSRKEGLPNVLLEAQLLGVPVVTSDAGGAGEAVNRGKSGWVVEGDDVKAFAEKVAYALTDREFIDGAKVLGPKFVEEKFGLGRMLDETIASYGVKEIGR